MFSDSYFEKFNLPDDLRQALSQCRSIAYIETQEELDELLEAAQEKVMPEYLAYQKGEAGNV